MTSLSLFFDRLEECFSGKTLISPDFEYFMIRTHLCPLIFELFTDDICWIIGFFVIRAFLRILHGFYFFFEHCCGASMDYWTNRLLVMLLRTVDL